MSTQEKPPRTYYAVWEDYSIDEKENVDETDYCSGVISTQGGGNLHWEENQFQVVHKDDYESLRQQNAYLQQNYAEARDNQNIVQARLDEARAELSKYKIAAEAREEKLREENARLRAAYER